MMLRDNAIQGLQERQQRLQYIKLIPKLKDQVKRAKFPTAISKPSEKARPSSTFSQDAQIPFYGDLYYGKSIELEQWKNEVGWDKFFQKSLKYQET
ncbi:hypothetical protein HK100_004324 [Physocladia obscura]|uniref:Uncharacterized protein n=1 Tax=Physocladia obscura TaxID=109957 RepID=A0AAD5XGR5_9FUNG|nr:hypothetical protein HK100_004324 [Physocladia obscura]